MATVVREYPFTVDGTGVAAVVLPRGATVLALRATTVTSGRTQLPLEAPIAATPVESYVLVATVSETETRTGTVAVTLRRAGEVVPPTGTYVGMLVTLRGVGWHAWVAIADPLLGITLTIRL